jgi:hypothetical protein
MFEKQMSNKIVYWTIFAVPLDNRKEDPKLFDTLHRSYGTSLVDIGMGLPTAFSVVGASVVFKIAWGPIVWGILSAIVGFILGFLIRLFVELVLKKKKKDIKRSTCRNNSYN